MLVMTFICMVMQFMVVGVSEKIRIHKLNRKKTKRRGGYEQFQRRRANMGKLFGTERRMWDCIHKRVKIFVDERLRRTA